MQQSTTALKATMYRHLLVPVDGTDLSTETVGRAVEFAFALGARVTFFHARPDHSASLFGESDIVRLAAPADYAYAYEGRSREFLSKAESAARARGVPCESISAISDTPYLAIIGAARDAGCDLIFMASHGRRTNLGMMLGSQTLKVLVNAGIPVLVSATANPTTASRVIGTIRDEHRSLAAVLHAWMHLIAQARRQGVSPDPALMRAIVRYLRMFPVALHHPKEDEFLFRRLRERTSEAGAELDELERQHARDERLVEELAAMVERLAEGREDLAKVEDAVSGYARFLWEHLGREEGVILPLAERCLTDTDWAEIDAAFAENRDPRFGGDTEAEFRRLFSRIVNLAPAEPAAAKA
jgi:hemerythrin-like domain-containing protein/nucleotide-binding universal stress UspA family protein